MLLLIIISFFVVSNNVLAAQPTIKAGVAAAIDPDYDDNSDNNCNAVIDGNTKKLMQQAFDIFKFTGIILAIALTIKDLINAVSEQKGDTYAKLGNKTLKRIIYAIAIFVLPTIINVLFDLIGLYGTCGIN